MMIIDGSTLEGGGQILRMALCFSSLLRQPIKITKIRAGRQKPGLAAQHLKGIELLRDLTYAEVKGLAIGSTEIEFSPKTIKQGNYLADTKTAGSIALLLQCALPVALFSDGHITLDLRGGTNCDMAPQIDTMTEIFRPNLEKFGATFDLNLVKRGYFPRGGGQCIIDIDKIETLNAVDITNFGEITKFFGWSFVAGSLHLDIGQEMYNGAKMSVHKIHSHKPFDIEVYKESQGVANASGSGIILGCCTTSDVILGGSSLGNRKQKSFKTGQFAADEILECTKVNACVDAHTQDQLIIFMSLANGQSRVRTGKLTLHTKTAIHIAELMTKAKFTINEEEFTTIIECVGINFKNE